MPSTWGLRRRPTDPDEEDLEVLQERYAARLEELLRPPDERSHGDEVDLPDASAGIDEDGAELPPRVALKVGSRPPIVVAGEGLTPATDAPSAKGASRARKDGPSSRKAPPHRKASARGTTRGATKATTRTPPAACPYCAVLLEPAPRASGRCPRCRQRIVVKRAGTRMVLLTEAAVPVFEAERRRSIEHGRHAGARDRWLRLARTAGAPEDRVRRLGSGLASESSVEAARALYLASVDRAFRAARADRHWELAERIRRDQATVLHRVAGRPLPPPDDIVAVYREGVSARLRGIAEVAREAELRGATCCEACAADDGRLFRVATERREHRLPHAGCPDGLCRCRWTLAEKDVAALRRLMARRPRPSSSADGGARTGD